MKNLLSCPFCGGDAVLLLSDELNIGKAGDSGSYDCVICKDCHAGTETFYGEPAVIRKLAVEAWNHRVNNYEKYEHGCSLCKWFMPLTRNYFDGYCSNPECVVGVVDKFHTCDRWEKFNAEK